MTPVEIRYLLDSFGAAFYNAQTETTRRKVVDHAVKVMAQFTPDQQVRSNALTPDAGSIPRTTCAPETPSP